MSNNIMKSRLHWRLTSLKTTDSLPKEKQETKQKTCEARRACGLPV